MQLEKFATLILTADFQALLSFGKKIIRSKKFKILRFHFFKSGLPNFIFWKKIIKLPKPKS